MAMFTRCNEKLYPDDRSPENVINTEILHWPIPSYPRDDLNNIDHNYCAVPLRVLANSIFVEVHDVNNIVKEKPLSRFTSNFSIYP